MTSLRLPPAAMALAAVTGFAFAAPAVAQPAWGAQGWGPPPHARGAPPPHVRDLPPHRFRGSVEMQLERQFRALIQRYEFALRSGRLTRSEAQRIDRRLREIDRLGQRYARGGFNRSQADRIARLIRETEIELQFAARQPGWRDAGWSWR